MTHYAKKHVVDYCSACGVAHVVVQLSLHRDYLEEKRVVAGRWDIRYVTRKTYLFPQTRRVGIPEAAARQYADARAAMRGSSAWECADAPRIYTMRSPRMSAKAYALDRRRVLGAGAVPLQCSHVTAKGLSPLVSHFVIRTPLRTVASLRLAWMFVITSVVFAINKRNIRLRW